MDAFGQGLPTRLGIAQSGVDEHYDVAAYILGFQAGQVSAAWDPEGTSVVVHNEIALVTREIKVARYEQNVALIDREVRRRWHEKRQAQLHVHFVLFA